jgi:hypothetical protein
LLTLSNEHGDEIATAMSPAGEAAVKSAILLLVRSETLRLGYRLTVSIEGDGAKRYARAAPHPGF